MDPRIQKILMQMQINLHRKLSLNSLAKSVNLSSWRLHHLFKAETGVPPAKYLKQLRMQKARYLLETTFLMDKEIMLRTGMGDESHFIRDFKRTYGMTPVRYRKLFLASDSDSKLNRQNSKIG